MIVIGQDNQGQDKIIIFQANYQELEDLRIQSFRCSVPKRDAHFKPFGILTNEEFIPRTYPYKEDQVFEIKNYVGYYVHEEYIIFVYSNHIREGWADFIWIYWNTVTKKFEEPQCSDQADAEYLLHSMNYVNDLLPSESKARIYEHDLTKLTTTPQSQEFVKPGDEANQRIKITSLTMSASGDFYFIDDSAYNDPITGGPILYNVKKKDWVNTSAYSVPTTATRIGSTGLSGEPIEGMLFIEDKLYGMSSTSLGIYEIDINTGEATYNCDLATTPSVTAYDFSSWTWSKTGEEMLLLHREEGYNELWKFTNKTPGSFAAEKESNLDSSLYGSKISLDGLGSSINNAVFSSMDDVSPAALMILETSSISGIVDDFWELGYNSSALFYNKTI
jgi:hypothetical protein